MLSKLFWCRRAIICAAVVCWAQHSGADAYKSASSGNWTSPTSWTDSTTPPTGAGYPGSGATHDTAIIDNTNVITIDSTQNIGSLTGTANPGPVTVGDVAASPGTLTLTGDGAGVGGAGE